VLEESGSYQVEWKEEGRKGRKTSVAEAADLLLSKCGGLPGVITTVAGYLASKPRDVLEQEMRRLSDNFMHVLATNTEFGCGAYSPGCIPTWMLALGILRNICCIYQSFLKTSLFGGGD
jgi:hypothetical protein